VDFQELVNSEDRMNIREKLKSFANKNLKEEVCGFVVVKNGLLDLIKCENRAEDKQNQFLIPAKEYLHIKNKHNILGVFHSHAFGDSTPSSFDIAMAESCCLPMIIYSNPERKFNFYNPSDSDISSQELEGVFL
jgi:proteasome lid subunit RPN8/RPN11